MRQISKWTTSEMSLCGQGFINVPKISRKGITVLQSLQAWCEYEITDLTWSVPDVKDFIICAKPEVKSSNLISSKPEGRTIYKPYLSPGTLKPDAKPLRTLVMTVKTGPSFGRTSDHTLQGPLHLVQYSYSWDPGLMNQHNSKKVL